MVKIMLNNLANGMNLVAQIDINMIIQALKNTGLAGIDDAEQKIRSAFLSQALIMEGNLVTVPEFQSGMQMGELRINFTKEINTNQIHILATFNPFYNITLPPAEDESEELQAFKKQNPHFEKLPLSVQEQFMS